MRIVGGRYTGIVLRAPKSQGVRPTTDRVREAVFNQLAARPNEARVLDLFSGSGALGLEALSRGAAHVDFVEKSATCLDCIRRNVRTGRFPADRIRIRQACVFKTLRDLADGSETFDLILADPPYGPKTASQRSESLSQQLLDDSLLTRLLIEDGLLVLGHATRDRVRIDRPWILRRQRRYGDATVEFLAV